MKHNLSSVCLLVVAAVTVCARGDPASEAEMHVGRSPEQGVRVDFSPAKLFDFANYKNIFHKTYSGPLVELVRRKYFLSRAFRAFISAIKYKYRKSNFYLAIDGRSDWTPAELESSENKVIAEASEEGLREADEIRDGEAVHKEPEDELADILPDDVEEVEEELKRIADSAKPGEPAYDELKLVIDGSVATPSSATQDANLRDLPIEKLIDTGADVHLDRETARKLTSRVKSNNPDYEPPELASLGLVDEQERVLLLKVDPELEKPERPEAELPRGEKNDIGSFVSALTNSLQSIVFGDPGKRGQLPDEVFLDLRDTNCFTKPREQGQCRSCYAFAAISIFEWMYCRQTGKLVEFSEQYMIDCGNQYVEGLRGCNGGLAVGVATFTKNFGLELRKNYPYNAQENQCPYDEGTSPKNTGFIRLNFESALMVPLEMAPKYLKDGPLHVIVPIWPAFHEYGGGVVGQGCPQKGSHAVVLLGHGRQDGEEYWLIRNSFSPGWGEGGYAKIAKKANCIYLQRGWLFAFNHGELKAGMRKNQLYDPKVVEGRGVQAVRLEDSDH